MKQMEAVRQKVLEKPGTLPRLVLQLQQGDTDAQAKAAEMLFCVVGQGPGRDAKATKQVSSQEHLVILQEVVVVNFITKSSPIIRTCVSWCCGSLSLSSNILPSLHVSPFDSCVWGAAGTR